MTTASAIIIMVACECLIILVLALSPTPFRMRGIGVVLNMLAIAIFGQGISKLAMSGIVVSTAGARGGYQSGEFVEG